MNDFKLASGDSINESLINISTDEEKIERENKDMAAFCDSFDNANDSQRNQEESDRARQCSEITTNIIDDHEAKLKERVEQCKSLIASLKQELTEEKNKLEKQTNAAQRYVNDQTQKFPKTNNYDANSVNFFTDIANSTNLFNTSVDNKLNCDENLMEYEKQLQRYQNTLNMAQIEKKNAIRKQMLAKAYKLKLLEVENQCNIELLRVKQSLQCLEPLQMIVEKWKEPSEDLLYDANNFELIPRYPELYGNSTNDVNVNPQINELNVKEPAKRNSIISNDDISNFD